jgi:hypothetical protein
LTRGERRLSGCSAPSSAGFEPDATDLDQWLAAVWPMVEDMDPTRWTRAYLIACGLVVDAEPFAVTEQLP